MSAWTDMGGYGAFVWPAYGVTVLALAVAVALKLRSYRRAKDRLAKLEKT